MLAEQVGSLSEAAYKSIKEKIITGYYPPGSILNEGDLADAHGVSRQPIRIAINRLYEDGWLAGNSRGKTRVKEISEKDVYEIFQARSLLELPALRAIFDKEKTWDFSFALEAIVLRMRADAHNHSAYEKHILDFHCYILGIFENARIEKIFNSNRDEIYRINMLAKSEEGNIAGYIEELLSLINAIREKDVDLAMNIYRKHLDDGLQKHLNIVRTILAD